MSYQLQIKKLGESIAVQFSHEGLESPLSFNLTDGKCDDKDALDAFYRSMASKDIALDIREDGSVSLKSCSIDVDLSVQSPESVVIEDGFKARSLTLSAKKVLLPPDAKIDIDRHAFIDVSERFENAAHLNIGRTLRVEGNTETARIQNKGHVECRNLRLKARSIQNWGDIHSEKKSYYHAHKRLINYHGASLLSDEESECNSTAEKSLIANQGVIKSPKIKMRNSKHRLHFINGEEGKIEASVRCQITSCEYFYNNGHIKALNQFVLGCYEFGRHLSRTINYLKGVIETRTAQLTLARNFHNYGHFDFKHIDSSVGGDIVNFETGVIHGEDAYQLKCVGKILNYFRIESEHGLSAEALAGIENSESGTFEGETGVALSSLEDIASDGAILSAGDIESRSSRLHLGSRSTTRSYYAKVALSASERLLAEGAIDAGKDIKTSSEGALHFTATSTTKAKGDIRLHGKTVTQEGEFEAFGELIVTALTRFLQTEHGHTWAQKAIQINADGKISLSGINTSEGSFFIESLTEILIDCGAELSSDALMTLLSTQDLKIGRATLKSKDTLSMDAKRALETSAESVVDAKDIALKTAHARHKGKIHASDSVTIEASQYFANLLSALVRAGKRLHLKSKDGFNAGTMKSKDYLKWLCSQDLKNTEDGKIKAHVVKTESGHDTTNRGLIKGDSVTLNASNRLSNKKTGRVKATTSLVAEAKADMINAGLFKSAGKLSLFAGLILKQLASGHIKAKKAIEIIAHFMVQNKGEITSQSTMLIKAREAIQNFASGKISARDTLKLLSDFWLINAGLIKGQSIVELSAKHAIENQLGALIKANILKTTGTRSLLNAGRLQGDVLELLLANHLLNTKTGQINAHTLVTIEASLIEQRGAIHARCAKLIADTIAQKGQIEIDAELQAKARLLLQYKSAEIKAALSIFNIDGLTNLGSIKSARLSGEGGFWLNAGGIASTDMQDLALATLLNQGDMSAESREMTISHLLWNLKGARFKSDSRSHFDARGASIFNDGEFLAGELGLQARSFIDTGHLGVDKCGFIDAPLMALKGTTSTDGKLSFHLGQTFVYDSSAIEANGTLAFKLWDARQIRQPISTPGSLEFSYDGARMVDWLTSLTTARDLTFITPNSQFDNWARHSVGGHYALSALGHDNHDVIKADSGAVCTKGDLRQIGDDRHKPVMDVASFLTLESEEGDIHLERSETYAETLGIKAKRAYRIKTAKAAADETMDVEAADIELLEASQTTAKQLDLKPKDSLTIGTLANRRNREISRFHPTCERGMDTSGLPDSWFHNGGVYTERLKIDGKKASGSIAGEVRLKGDGEVELERLRIEARQKVWLETVTDVHTSSSWGGLKKSKKTVTKTIERRETQAGSGSFVSEGGQVSVHVDHFAGNGGTISAPRGVYLRANFSFEEHPLTDVSIAHCSSGDRSFWGSSSSSTHHARPKMVPMQVVSSQGPLQKISMGSMTLYAPRMMSRDDLIIYAKRLLEMHVVVNDVELPPEHNARAFSVSTRFAMQEVGLPPVAVSLEGNIKISSDGFGRIEAPMLIAPMGRIRLEAASMATPARVLNHSSRTTSNGLSDLSYYETQTDSKTQTAMQPYFKAKEDEAVIIEASKGDCDVQAPIVEAGRFKMHAKGDTKLHPLILTNQVITKSKSLGVSFFGSNALSTALNEDADGAVRALAQDFFPSIGHLGALIKDQDTADRFADSIKLAWSAYKTAQGLEAAGSVSQYLQGQIHQRWSIHSTRSRQSQDWEDAALPSLRVVEFKDEAGRNACLEGVGFGASTKTVQVKAEHDIHWQPATVHQSAREDSESFRGHFDGSQVIGAGYSASRAKSSATQFLHDVVRGLEKLSFTSGGKTTLDGMRFETKQAKVDVANFIINTWQEKSKSHQASGSIDVGGSFAASVRYGHRKSAWARQQAGILAHDRLDANIRDTLGLNGGVLLVDDRGTGTVRAPRVVFSDVYDEDKSRSVGLSIDGFVDADHRQSHQSRINRATISSRVELITDSDVERLNRDVARARETLIDEQSHYRIAAPVEALEQAAQALKEKEITETEPEAVLEADHEVIDAKPPSYSMADATTSEEKSEDEEVLESSHAALWMARHAAEDNKFTSALFFDSSDEPEKAVNFSRMEPINIFDERVPSAPGMPSQTHVRDPIGKLVEKLMGKAGKKNVFLKLTSTTDLPRHPRLPLIGYGLDRALLLAYEMRHLEHELAPDKPMGAQLATKTLDLFAGVTDLGHHPESIVVPAAYSLYKKSKSRPPVVDVTLSHLEQKPKHFSRQVKKAADFVFNHPIPRGLGTTLNFGANAFALVGFSSHMGLTSQTYPDLSPTSLILSYLALKNPAVLGAMGTAGIAKLSGEVLHQAAVDYQHALPSDIQIVNYATGTSEQENALATQVLGKVMVSIGSFVLEIPVQLKETGDEAIAFLSTSQMSTAARVALDGLSDTEREKAAEFATQSGRAAVRGGRRMLASFARFFCDTPQATEQQPTEKELVKLACF